MIEVRQLRHFLAVIEHGGIRQAARSIHLSASAIARSISMLESHYGVELLSRDKQQMMPTVFGLRLAEDSKNLVAGFDGIGDRLAQLSNLESGTLRVGIGPSLSPVLMPPVATRMAKLYPRVRMEITYDHALASMERMGNHDLDVAIGLHAAMSKHGDYELIPLYREVVEWWVRKAHPLTKRKRLRAANLVDYPVVTQFLPAPFSDWFSTVALQVGSERKKGSLNNSLRCNDYAILKQVAINSDAILLSPRQTVLNSQYAKRLVAIPLPKPPEIMVSAALPQFPSPQPLARRFVELVQEVARELLDVALDD